jgi:predicted AlkP superfamily pyrophosphatase or phosphodiesterase
MAIRVCLIDLPGLSRELLASVPGNSAMVQWLATQKVAAMTPTWPAVTCSVQATLTTGVPPSQHGIIANGIATFRSKADQDLVDASNFASYRREVSFWEQSNQLVQAPRFWQDASGRSRYKTALLFFQQSMPGFSGDLKPAADIVITPKPEHGPDGKITSLLWAQPRELVGELFKELGPFPLMNYWGPMAGIASSQWIAKAAARVWQMHRPQLQLVYVPHLDYDLHRFGPDSPQARKAVEDVANALDPLVTSVLAEGGKLVVLSEYAMRSVTRCISPNRELARAGLLTTRSTSDGTLIDYATTPAFAMVDHQVAHVYTRDAQAKEVARQLLSKLEGVKLIPRIEHPRAGDLMIEASDDAWIDYRWWESPSDAPVFAKMVDIHRKPGYDPLELFFDPVTKGVSQDAARIKGSHGVVRDGEAIFVGGEEGALQAADVAGAVKRMLGS